jgi:hypothetical protein
MTTATVPPVEVTAPGLTTRVPEGQLAGGQRLRLLLGALVLVASAVGALLGEDARRQFFFSYLVAFTFSLSIALGATVFVLIQHLTRAGWSVTVRRTAENVMGTMPWFVLLFVPIAVGHHDLWHHWIDAVVDPAQPGYDPILAGKRVWLNLPFFFARTAVYFAIWIFIASWFRRRSLEQDATGDPAITLRMARFAAPMMLLLALSMTFAAFDWLMSLDPHWFSTMWGVYFFAGCFLSFMALLGLLCMYLQRQRLLREAVSPEHYHDIGKLLFAFVVFWTYIAFSQFMLIWYANLPEETVFFRHRMSGSWLAVSQVLILGHFAIPFGFLMSRHVKRNRTTLAVGAGFMLVMHAIDLHWIVMPVLHEHGVHLSWLDATTLLGVFAIFIGLVLRNVRSTPLVPLRDPRLRESLHFRNV